MADKLYGSPQMAPEYVLHRHLEGAADGASEIIMQHGINMAGFEWANIQVVPSAMASPVVQVLFWSEEAAKYIVDHTEIEFLAKGDGVAWEASIDARGRKIFVKVVSGVPAGQECKIFVAGYRNRHS